MWTLTGEKATVAEPRAWPTIAEAVRLRPHSLLEPITRTDLNSSIYFSKLRSLQTYTVRIRPAAHQKYQNTKTLGGTGGACFKRAGRLTPDTAWPKDAGTGMSLHVCREWSPDCRPILHLSRFSYECRTCTVDVAQI